MSLLESLCFACRYPEALWVG